MIKRNFTDRSKEVIIPLYKSLVRPHLEYIVAKYGITIIARILEGVQRRATKLITGMQNLSL